MHADIARYNETLSPTHRLLCASLADTIDAKLPDAESKIWHAHPVWFLSGNPIVGYSQQKAGIRLMFWSGADFGEAALHVVGKKFRDASIFLNAADDFSITDLTRWLAKAREIQWNYRDIVKRKGTMERLT